MSLSSSERSRSNVSSLLGLFARIGEIAGDSPSFTAAIHGAVREICAYTAWPAGHALVVERRLDNPQLVSAGDWYFSRQSKLDLLKKTGPVSFACGEGLPGLVWERGHELALTRVQSLDPRFLASPAIAAGAWFGFPVLFDGRIEAVLEFCSDAPAEMDREFAYHSKSIAIMLASALQQERLRFLNLIVEKAHDGVIVYAVDRRQAFPLTIVYVNQPLERQSGYAASELVGHAMHLLSGPDVDETYVRGVVEKLLAGETVQTDIRKYRKDGTTLWVEVTLRPVAGSGGEVQYVVSVQREITERKRAQQQLELLSTALEQASDMIAMFERTIHDRWRLCYANQLFLKTTGYPAEEVLNRDASFMEGPETDVERLREFRKAAMRGEACRAEMAYYRKDGSVFWVDLNARPILSPDGIATHAIVLYHDITESRRHAQMLSYEASHDPLTGLYNRRYFLQALENALRGSRDGSRRHALLFVDLDGFKLINDSYGHEAGDSLLAGVAQRLHGAMREGDVIARVGGDEFAVLLHDCSPEAALHVAHNLLAVVQSYAVDRNGATLTVGASIGVSCGESGAFSPSDAMRKADEACYEAKRRGGNCAVL